MEYSINKLARMSGVSTRTLRYYDQIGLLKPMRVASSGYRIYGRAEVDRLQQILLFRELGFALDDIGALISVPDFDRERAFSGHLQSLLQKRERLDALIENVTRSLGEMRGENEMEDSQKFEGFAQKLIDENERKYGEEIRRKYGDETVNESNARLKGMTEAQFKDAERLALEVEQAIRHAMETGGPEGEAAQKACDLHRQWLCIYYPRYNKEYHRALGEMYVADERFKAYYDKIAPGAAEFFSAAISIYCAE